MTTIPVPVLAAAVAVVSAVPLIGWALFARPQTLAVQARDNLTRGIALSADRTSGRARSALGVRLVTWLTPDGTVARLDRLAGRAGRPADWPVSKLVAAKLVLLAVAGGLGVLVVSSHASALNVLVVLAVTGIAYFVPELLLYSRGQERQEAIGLELADTLDQMTIAVEAGLGFESAMSRAGKNGKGPLAERTGATDLRRFIGAVVQADAYGVSIADVLRTQAQEMRLKRRQRAEEKAMQIPVKVIFPLILCILPTLFIVLLGPAVMDMMAAFSK